MDEPILLTTERYICFNLVVILIKYKITNV